VLVVSRYLLWFMLLLGKLFKQKVYISRRKAETYVHSQHLERITFEYVLHMNCINITSIRIYYVMY
jgi:hypothetical protein